MECGIGVSVGKLVEFVVVVGVVDEAWCLGGGGARHELGEASVHASWINDCWMSFG